MSRVLTDLFRVHLVQRDREAFARNSYPVEFDPNWGKVLRVPVGDLKDLLDHKHDKLIGEAHARRLNSLRELFDVRGAAAVSPIFIHWFAGSVFLLDGYHRLHVALERGLEHVTAIWVKVSLRRVKRSKLRDERGSQ